MLVLISDQDNQKHGYEYETNSQYIIDPTIEETLRSRSIKYRKFEIMEGGQINKIQYLKNVTWNHPIPSMRSLSCSNQNIGLFHR